MSFEELFGDDRVMVILRGLPPEDTVALAHTAWDAGVNLLEVPIGEPGQEKSLAAAVAAGAERGLDVGAGTVVSRAHVDAAAAAGAAYTVAPGLDPDVAAASFDAGMPHLPGVATASEIQRALAAGCDWVKAFPAAALGTSWFRAMHGPFPHLNIVATGGVSVASAPDFLAAGASVAALGSALADPQAVAGLARLVADTTRD
ncbi:bifunctional 4-hydroxy-2-oxoglutarate aldolase/2-dehydro-3-deoxy-phosphogluconate aldolase [Stackebrandtia nassauensis]|uniref:KDPG and KHG aldolase n=1 Tax=Stackebrandtia nassauensis (strain DSM 44728 / CIP 108903 / NRRL B-16338 / NBRC 102104 / LLR-40K-21) TaxID=446470 RepID=D3PYV8_STANL|nr:bifunctional 4-hydroxy-2-oxoglutarate aldolase/2-dehydro-3-deoxy-phosphogluconate aldolase [Stackebrandtia nassauensis]ADD43541.1 KDPG and KHG aldolase [Stackebrandtia nassauensis DSM 44728]